MRPRGVSIYWINVEVGVEYRSPPISVMGYGPGWLYLIISYPEVLVSAHLVQEQI